MLVLLTILLACSGGQRVRGPKDRAAVKEGAALPVWSLYTTAGGLQERRGMGRRCFSTTTPVHSSLLKSLCHSTWAPGRQKHCRSYLIGCCCLSFFLPLQNNCNRFLKIVHISLTFLSSIRIALQMEKFFYLSLGFYALVNNFSALLFWNLFVGEARKWNQASYFLFYTRHIVCLFWKIQ